MFSNFVKEGQFITLIYLDKEFDINPQTQEKFAEIVLKIYKAIFVSLCKDLLKRTNRPGKNPHWVKDLNIQDHKDLSSYYSKMRKVPLGTKRVKLSNNHDGIYGYGKKKNTILMALQNKHTITKIKMIKQIMIRKKIKNLQKK